MAIKMNEAATKAFKELNDICKLVEQNELNGFYVTPPVAEFCVAMQVFEVEVGKDVYVTGIDVYVSHEKEGTMKAIGIQKLDADDCEDSMRYTINSIADTEFPIPMPLFTLNSRAFEMIEHVSGAISAAPGWLRLG